MALQSTTSCAEAALSALFGALHMEHPLIDPSTRGAIVCSLIRHWPHELTRQLSTVLSCY